MKKNTKPLSFEPLKDAIDEVCAEVRAAERRCDRVSVRVVLTEAGALELRSHGSTEGVYASEWHGCDYALSIDHARSADALYRFLDSKRVLTLLTRVRSGHSTDWEGNNYVGRLTDDASDADDVLQRLAGEYDDSDAFGEEIGDGLYGEDYEEQ